MFIPGTRFVHPVVQQYQNVKQLRRLSTVKNNGSMTVCMAKIATTFRSWGGKQFRVLALAKSLSK
jgi:hypothetical protein